MSGKGLIHAKTKMARAGVHEIAIDVFARFYDLLERDVDAIIHEDDVSPLVDVMELGDVFAEHAGEDIDPTALSKTAIIKLNGGLGTSMGMQKAKSLLPVRDGLTFLDIIARQVLEARERYGVNLPLVFMNSFRTEADTLAALESYPELKVEGIELSMLQNQEPKIVADTLEPLEFPADPELEWCPPGHGDLYTVLQTSGMLDALEAAGIEILNISNADNLGAYPSASIASWFEASDAPFVAEVVRRTPADRKGGHIVVRDGQLTLRETAQIDAEDEAQASDISKHKFFNANNLWIKVSALREVLAEHNGVMPLPLIRNEKTADPSDPTTEKVVQLESAMGAAIELFPGAAALRIDRSRFLPVKTTNDLLLVRSDVYDLTDRFRLEALAEEPLITLDPAHFGLIDDFEGRFPAGAPSLVHAKSLTVTGPWTFGADVSVRGDAALDGQDGQERTVADGTVVGE